MSVPIDFNTTCDVYRVGTAPPAAPAIPSVPIVLMPKWEAGQERGDRNVAALTWTHIALFELVIDVRDLYAGSATAVNQDTVYVPDKNGTPFRVVFVERVLRNTDHEHKRVYLDRKAPTWPSNNL